MTPELEAKIEQREAMLARVVNTIRLAKGAAEGETNAAIKKQHEHVVFLKTQWKDELERQLKELRGTPSETASNPS